MCATCPAHLTVLGLTTLATSVSSPLCDCPLLPLASLLSQPPDVNLHIKIRQLPFDAIKRLSSSPHLLTTLGHNKVHFYRFHLHAPGGMRVLLKTHPPSEHTEDAACHLTHLLSLASRSFHPPLQTYQNKQKPLRDFSFPPRGR